MSEQLGQSEIDSLLSGSAELAEPEDDVRLIFTRDKRDSSDLEVAGYDFKRPERVSKDQMRALQTLHEAFARNFGAALSGFLRTIVEVQVATCEQMTYGEFIAGLPNPTSFNLIGADDLEGQICLEISPLIIYPIIDRLLGGTSEDLFIPQRPMTQIESRLVSNITSRGLAALSEAWEGIRALKFSVSATESNPQLVQIVPPNEVVIVIGLETRMANRAGTMNLCIPYNVIEPIMGELAAQSWFAVDRSHRDANVTKSITNTLSRAPVNVSAVIAETTITLRDFAEMQVGDLIATSRPADHPAVLCVEGEPKYCGFLGQFRGTRAIRIDRQVKPGDRL